MTITTDDAILKFGTQEEVTSGTPATIASGSWGEADQGGTVLWTADDHSEFANAVLKCQFDTTMPTTGFLGLYARVMNVQSTNDSGIPDANFPHYFCGAFPIDYGVAADTDFYTIIPIFRLPVTAAGQFIEWYIKNDGTSQTMGVSWQLWITARTTGPHA